VTRVCGRESQIHREREIVRTKSPDMVAKTRDDTRGHQVDDEFASEPLVPHLQDNTTPVDGSCCTGFASSGAQAAGTLKATMCAQRIILAPVDTWEHSNEALKRAADNFHRPRVRSEQSYSSTVRLKTVANCKK